MPRSTNPAKRLTVELPAPVARLLGGTDAAAAACLTRLALVDLYRRGEVSTGYAADVLGLSVWELIQLLDRHGVPYVDLTKEEVREQVSNAEALVQRARSASAPTQAP